MKQGKQQQAQAQMMLTYDPNNRNPFYRRRQIAIPEECRYPPKKHKRKVRAVAAKKHVTMYYTSR